jgi:hypothetical protein
MCAHQVRPYGPRVTRSDRTTSGTPHYEIRVAGRLDARWSAWFDGLRLIESDDGTTVIRGPIVDQAALHGLLQRLRDVGIPLVALTPVASDGTTPGPAPRANERTQP